MEFPNISYIISTHQHPHDQSIETLLLAKPKNDEYDAIVICQENSDMQYSGNDIIFDRNKIIVDGIIFNLNSLAIGIEDNKCYLLIEENNKKLWHLPDLVIDFLEMNEFKINYCLSLIDDQPYVLKKQMRNTVNNKILTEWSKKLILRTSEGFHSNDTKFNTSNVTFHLFESDDKTTQLSNSYFNIYNSEYKLNECYVLKKDRDINIFCNLKINNESNINSACFIGYVDDE